MAGFSAGENLLFLGENDGLGLPGLARMFFAKISCAFQERKDSQTTNIQEPVGCLDFVMDILACTDLSDAILFYLLRCHDLITPRKDYEGGQERKEHSRIR